MFLEYLEFVLNIELDIYDVLNLVLHLTGWIFQASILLQKSLSGHLL